MKNEGSGGIFFEIVFEACFCLSLTSNLDNFELASILVQYRKLKLPSEPSEVDMEASTSDAMASRDWFSQPCMLGIGKLVYFFVIFAIIRVHFFYWMCNFNSPSILNVSR